MNDVADLIVEIIKLPFRFIRWIFRLPFIKGKLGEHKVLKLLKKLTKKNGVFINNLTIGNETSSKTHQIDHVLISTKGIFSIETKNYSGRIYGNDNNREWTQVLNYGKVKNRFYSPVKQNETHIYSMKEIIKESVNINNIVIFLNADIDRVDSNYVFTRREFKRYYKRMDDNVLSEEQVTYIYEKLINSKLDIKNREHVKNIKIMKKDIDNNVCPRCGGTLIERNGKYGTFMGCSNYPKCKFIKH